MRIALELKVPTSVSVRNQVVWTENTLVLTRSSTHRKHLSFFSLGFQYKRFCCRGMQPTFPTATFSSLHVRIHSVKEFQESTHVSSKNASFGEVSYRCSSPFAKVKQYFDAADTDGSGSGKKQQLLPASLGITIKGHLGR